ncbi:hypothetical protein [Rubidibacter lacunae]|uniref:hypothetical protein n=1 Tax=Rubidibacter lacunae TaxID=582514 RepID=UPI001E3B1C4B|nr:hypothetical protein [Rubidibacter lacunae]
MCQLTADRRKRLSPVFSSDRKIAQLLGRGLGWSASLASLTVAAAIALRPRDWSKSVAIACSLFPYARSEALWQSEGLYSRYRCERCSDELGGTRCWR